ncbi:MAG: CTP synthase, partial [Verrucomicrobiia bacterium]
MKYIFITGGVVSSLGKGLTAASIGTLLESRGFRVVLQKFDPYLNVDPGTMSPFQHGEVYVLEDGAETDLDLGHYERFTSAKLTRHNNLTSGQIYESVISRERAGEYLGATIQVIPHVTDEIKNRIRQIAAQQPGDILITEIGGTTGDIEGMPFLEAIRQFSQEVGAHNVLLIHLTLVPFLKAAGELKTKPTQQSVAKLREIGLQPQLLLCRTEHPLSLEIRKKIALFCNVSPECVMEQRDVDHTIYEAPLMLHREKMDELICKHLQLPETTPQLQPWEQFVKRVISPSQKRCIAVVGKYIEHQDAYKSVYESLTHAAAAQDIGVELLKVDAEMIEEEGPEIFLKKAHGILVPGGFGERGTEGKIAAIRYAREKRVPYLGLCLGMQLAVVEFARHVLQWNEANSAEFSPETLHPVITLLNEQKEVTQKGGTMRLGVWPCDLVEDTRSREFYGQSQVNERH